jgi:signal transduction histidine kinase
MMRPYLMCFGTELVANANDSIVRSGRKDGRIELTVSLGDRVRVIVEDNGTGLTSEGEARLFTRLELRQETLTGVVGGKGIGLSLLAERVARCQGVVGFVNKGLGDGATFWFDVPSDKVHGITIKPNRSPWRVTAGASR